MGVVACVLIGLLILALSMRGTRKRERTFVQVGFVAHVAGTFALVGYYVYATPGGDMLGYAFHGRQLARLMDLDVAHYGPEVVKLALHLENKLPPVVSYDDASAEYLVGTTTTTMFALTGLVMYVVGGNLLSASLVFGLFAFGGTAFFYKRLRDSLQEHERLAVLGAMMFVPSVIFWTSGVVKETVLLGFFGLLCGALHDLLARRRLLSAVLVVVGATGVALVKPYVLFPLALSTGAWLNARSRRTHGWLTRLAAIAVAIFAIAALSQLFPQFGVDRLGETVAGQQGAGAYGRAAGSYVEVGAPEERSLVGQLRFIPLALLNSLARPFVFEARNASMLMASLETTAAGLLVFFLVRRYGLRGLYRRIAGRPPFVAAAVFTLSFGAAVGLTTTNLGTLSRYRAPMIPMYAGVLLALRARRIHVTVAPKGLPNRPPRQLASRRAVRPRHSAPDERESLSRDGRVFSRRRVGRPSQ